MPLRIFLKTHSIFLTSNPYLICFLRVWIIHTSSKLDRWFIEVEELHHEEVKLCWEVGKRITKHLLSCLSQTGHSNSDDDALGNLSCSKEKPHTSRGSKNKCWFSIWESLWVYLSAKSKKLIKEASGVLLFNGKDFIGGWNDGQGGARAYLNNP